MLKDVPSVDVLLMFAVLCAVGLARIVREQVTATDVRSKAIATLPRFRLMRMGDSPSNVSFISFIGIFFWFCIWMSVIRYPIPGNSGRSSRKLFETTEFFDPPSPRLW